MSLDCSCAYGDFEWYYHAPKDFVKIETSKRKRCCSCEQLIDIGSDVLSFERYRGPRSDYEEQRFGDEAYLADWYMCESCSEKFLNLTSIGYCIILGDCMDELMRLYHEKTGFVPADS